MPKSVNSVASRKRRKKFLNKQKDILEEKKRLDCCKKCSRKSLTYAYRDRKNKKRTFRALWITRINAGARLHDLSYSELMGKLKQNNIDINRKVLADLAMNNPEAFSDIVKKVK